MTFGSLFAGIGGFDLGLERAGMTCEWQVEIDPYARRVLEKHWPDVRRWDDVRTFPPDGEWGVDLICGGFPCQPVSAAGARMGENDERWLWPEFVRVLRIFRPRIALLENTTGLFTLGFGAAFSVTWPARSGSMRNGSVLSACSMGAPHSRERVFIVANSDCERRQGLCSEQQKVLGGKSGVLEIRSAPDGRWNKQLPTPRFCRGVDGIPRKTQRLRCLGNAVVPQVAEWIGRRIMEAQA